MALMPMYPGQPNSPQTELAENIDETQTTIPLLDASVLPPGPNLAVIGSGEHAETVLYESIDGDNLINCTRGFQGVASSWQAGQKVARNFTAYDYDALRQNLESHGSEHNHDGSDPIPDLVQLRDGFDDHKNEIRSLGLGIDVDPRISSDLNNEINTGWVRFETGETLNRPSDEIPGFPHSGVVRVDRRHDNRLAQTAYGVAGGTSVRIAVRALGSTGWGDWVEILHTGNTTNIVNQDYETGTWTPEYITTGNPFANISFTAGSSGSYTKIGRLVFIRFNLSTGYLEKGNASGELRIAGLPFPHGETSTTRYTGLTIVTAARFEISPIENYYMWRMAVVPNSTEIVIFQNDPNTTASTAGPEILQDHTSSSSNNIIRASGVYYTSS